MFKEWGFLLGEIWFLLLLAALIGLLAGWLFWGKREEAAPPVEDLQPDLDKARADLATCRKYQLEKEREILQLKEQLEQMQTAKPSPAPRTSAPAARPAPVKVQAPKPRVKATPKAASKPAPKPKPQPKPKTQPKAKAGGKKPRTLKQARRGKPDDLKLIKGVGPQLEQLCNKLGFYHFDQVAKWTKDEVVWVDENLEGFKGRVSRDKWVSQAKTLARGGDTEFSRRRKR